jgi:hypothetical protein
MLWGAKGMVEVTWTIEYARFVVRLSGHCFLFPYVNVKWTDRSETNPMDKIKSSAWTERPPIMISMDCLAWMRTRNRMEVVGGHRTLRESQVVSEAKNISRNKWKTVLFARLAVRNRIILALNVIITNKFNHFYVRSLNDMLGSDFDTFSKNVQILLRMHYFW